MAGHKLFGVNFTAFQLRRFLKWAKTGNPGLFTDIRQALGQPSLFAGHTQINSMVFHPDSQRPGIGNSGHLGDQTGHTFATGAGKEFGTGGGIGKRTGEGMFAAAFANNHYFHRGSGLGILQNKAMVCLSAGDQIATAKPILSCLQSPPQTG